MNRSIVLMRKVILLSMLPLALFLTTAYADKFLQQDFEGDGGWSYRAGWERYCNESYNGNCSAMYQTNDSSSTPIAIQKFENKAEAVCEFSVWIRTELEDPPRHPDGTPTRTGVSVQLWDKTGSSPRVALDLDGRNVTKSGYRGQGGHQGWTNYKGQVKMAVGPWEIRLYMHPVRVNDPNKATKVTTVRNARGRAWVDYINVSRVK
jgi:hypothetical protein